jgi:hypothetical protein
VLRCHDLAGGEPMSDQLGARPREQASGDTAHSLGKVGGSTAHQSGMAMWEVDLTGGPESLDAGSQCGGQERVS